MKPCLMGRPWMWAGLPSSKTIYTVQRPRLGEATILEGRCEGEHMGDWVKRLKQGGRLTWDRARRDLEMS